QNPSLNPSPKNPRNLPKSPRKEDLKFLLGVLKSLRNLLDQNHTNPRNLPQKNHANPSPRREEIENIKSIIKRMKMNGIWTWKVEPKNENLRPRKWQWMNLIKIPNQRKRPRSLTSLKSPKREVLKCPLEGLKSHESPRNQLM